MSKYILTDFELNGYNDSDFIASYYDDVTDTIGFTCYGTTRFFAPTNIGFNADGTTTVVVDGETCLAVTAEIAEKARIKLASILYEKLVEQDKRRVDEPDVSELTKGMKVRVHTNCKMAARNTEPCIKCSGSGHWVNPKNANDKRECFSCRGSGQHTGAKVKGADGKQVWDIVPAGTVGEVEEWKSFGTFFARGYNQPCRENTTLTIKTASGKMVRAGLAKVCLDRGYKTEAELRETAEGMSYNYGFSRLYPRHAWDTYNFAATVAMNAKKAG